MLTVSLAHIKAKSKWFTLPGGLELAKPRMASRFPILETNSDQSIGSTFLSESEESCIWEKGCCNQLVMSAMDMGMRARVCNYSVIQLALDWTCLLQLHRLYPHPHYYSIWRQGLWRILGHEGGALWMGLMPYKRDPREISCSFSNVRTQREDCCLWPEALRRHFLLALGSDSTSEP